MLPTDPDVFSHLSLLLSTLIIIHSPFSQTSKPFISPLISSKWLSHSTEKREASKQELRIPPSTNLFCISEWKRKPSPCLRPTPSSCLPDLNFSCLSHSYLFSASSPFPSLLAQMIITYICSRLCNLKGKIRYSVLGIMLSTNYSRRTIKHFSIPSPFPHLQFSLQLPNNWESILNAPLKNPLRS